MTQFIDTLVGIFQSSGFAQFGQPGGWLYAVMICVGCFLLYLAIVKEFEPLILLPMAFGMILANLPGSGIIHMQYFVGDGLEHPMWVEILNNGGLADMLYMGVKLGIYPPLIFLGIGTMTDFAPLISNPKSLLLGAAAQFGIFGTYMGARLLAATGLVDFTQKQSAAISIIGGADGPTAIFVTSRLAPELLGSIAVAAYSYMALVPVIQPPIMKALTTSKERYRGHEAAAHRLQDREGHLPHHGRYHCFPHRAGCRRSGRYADAGQPDEGVRRCGSYPEDRRQ